MGTVRYSPTARVDLLSIADWIARDSPAAAARLVDQIDAKLELLADFPEASEAVGEILPEMRRSLVGSYVVYHRRRGDELEVIRIVHGARDIRNIFP